MSKKMSKLVEYLQTNNYEMAIATYNQRPQPLSEIYSLELARAFFINQKYEITAQISEKHIHSNDPRIYFDSNALLIKAKYLCGSKVAHILQEFQKTVNHSPTQFNRGCIEAVRQIRQSIQSEFSLPASSMNKMQLKQFGKQFKNLYEKESFDNPLTDCMPMFIVSSRWLKLWELFVGLTESEKPPVHPGPITHFQILDHRYSMLYDSTPQKKYTNYLIYPGASAVVLPRSCWQLLRQKFKGIQLKRFNVWVSGKPREIITEIYLKKIKIRRANDNFIYEVQITKKQTWGGLIKKVKSIWKEKDTFTILQQENQKYRPVPENSFLEEVNTLDVVYVFGQPSKQAKTVISATASALQRCQNCGKTKQLKYCQCRSVKYCDAKCQKEDRDKHRKKCQIQCSHLNQKSAVLQNFNLPERAYGGRKGLVGLRNLGNTCYMNSGLQCMSNTKQLTEYFMRNDFIKQINHNNPLGTKGNLACAYAQLVRQMWTGSQSAISPFNLKKIIGKFAGQFSGYGQQDSQQFISYLIDGLQQDLNLVKKKETFQTPDDIVPDEEGSRRSEENYSKRIKSFIRDLMVGQFKSTVICEKCNKMSICFDPYLLLSLPISGLKENEVFYISMDCSKSTKKLNFTSDYSNTVGDLRRQVQNYYKTQENVRFIFSVVELKNFSVLAFDIKDNVSINQVSSKISNSDIVLIAYQIVTPKPNEQTYEIVYFLNENKKCFPRYVNIPKSASSNEITAILSQSITRFVPSKYMRDQQIKDFIQPPERTNDRKILIKLKKSIDMLLCSSENRTLKLQKYDRRTNLYDCLTNFTNTETLQGHNKWYCSKCKNHERASKQMEIYKSNQILVLTFKRFTRGFKVKDLIDFPIQNLNMGPYIKSNKQNKDIIYDLYGVVNHYGTMSGGHYTAYCQNFITKDWYEFDDSRVSKASPKEIVSEAAYVLFYRLRI